MTKLIIPLSFSLIVIFTSCAHLSTRQKAILATAPVARAIEAARDSEAFERPTEDRSFLWHAAKVPQFASWAVWGYLVIEQIKSDPSMKSVAIGVGSLGLAWVSFESGLWLFRRIEQDGE